MYVSSAKFNLSVSMSPKPGPQPITCPCYLSLSTGKNWAVVQYDRPVFACTRSNEHSLRGEETDLAYKAIPKAHTLPGVFTSYISNSCRPARGAPPRSPLRTHEH